jgi:DNA mismatch endonuclease, patch repair protein
MKETPEARSRVMRAVKGRNTKPEMTVRRLVHGMGFRYRLHRKDLPGKPDMTFSSRRKIIFIHGCFWHGHDCKRGARIPKNNRDYWVAKIARNRRRDSEHYEALRENGWRALVVWECQLKDRETVAKRIKAFLESGMATCC